MQANEFAKNRKVSTPVATEKPAQLVEKKLKFKKMPLPVNTASTAPTPDHTGPADLIGPGAQVKPGTELHRIRTHNPTLWTKIQNWD